MDIIIYGSKYGTSERYARTLAEKTGFALKACGELTKTDIDACGTIVYIGGLYAGGVFGLKKLLGRIKSPEGKQLIIVSVGVTDPTDKAYTDTVKSGIKKQLSAKLRGITHIFHLRGGVDYSALSFAHRTLLNMLYKKAVKMPEQQRTADIKAIIETHNKQVDFVDAAALEPIVHCIKTL